MSLRSINSPKRGNSRLKGGRFFASLLAVMFIFGGGVFSGCGGESPESTGTDQASGLESFTFFDVGRNTRYSDTIRDRLREQLGSDAISRRSIIDLEINYPGFLETHFPKLAELDRRLNFPPRERVDHDVIKLMYRYAQKKNTPFNFVEILFSGEEKKPLLIRIEIQEDQADILDALKDKYGEPSTVDWRMKGKSTYWEKNDDLLIFSEIPTRYGDFDYQVMIFFTDHIEELVQKEEARKAALEKKKKKAGQSAF